ncbi:DNA replication and repair protein RecF [bacterium HR15]|nr:DNA replication and repair protein RecF [bacterium HR15]
MRVKRLRLRNFRNYAQAEIEPCAGLNVLVGANAQGKTNLLEALYYASTFRSLRPVRESDFVRWGEQEAMIHLCFLRQGIEEELLVKIPLNGKRMVWLNEQPVSRQSELIGRLKVVCFTAQDLLLVRGEPAERRRFLDSELSLISPRYLYSAAQYRRCLEQRNNLLRAHLEGHAGLESLPEWDGQLVKYGARLFAERRRFLEQLQMCATEVHRALTGGKEAFQLLYQPGLLHRSQLPDKEEDWASAFQASLREVESEEIRRGMTLVGPHRDDFLILIDGHEARLFASQGQQRTCALSLRLAEVPLIEKRIEESPVVLMDDVFSDLDPERRMRLMRFLQPRTQTFLTCTSLSDLADLSDSSEAAAIYHIQKGQVFHATH